MTAPTSAADRTLRLLMLEGESAQVARQLVELIPVVSVYAPTHFDHISAMHASEPFDVAFVDLETCGYPAAIVDQLRNMDPGLPIIVLDCAAAEDEALHWLEFGAVDYLLKDQLSLDGLVRALRYAMRISKLERRLMMVSGGLEKTHQRICDVSAAMARRRHAALKRGTDLLREKSGQALPAAF